MKNDKYVIEKGSGAHALAHGTRISEAMRTFEAAVRADLRTPCEMICYDGGDRGKPVTLFSWAPDAASTDAELLAAADIAKALREGVTR
jgi:hypothetical protein